MYPMLKPWSQATHFVFVVSLLCAYLASSYQQVCDHQDQSSLLTFFTSISTSSSQSLNWSYATSCCQWEGVFCDVNGKVVRLELSSRGLEGAITYSIGNLISLTHLNLSNNNLHGSLGEGIVGLTNLRIMDLSSNNLSGPIPEGIGNLLYLERLYLSNNRLIGPIPVSLMNCTNLVDINLRWNNLDGDISKLDMSNLVQLEKFDLGYNSFNGHLPDSVYSCKSLIAIRVAQNNLSGQISPKIIQLESLSFLSLAMNSFTNIRRTLRVLAKCKNLTIIFLGPTNFYGESLPSNRNFIPSTGFPKLVYISFNGCNLTGFFPEWLRNLKTLQVLDFNRNKITGELPGWIGTLPNLYSIKLKDNNLFGEIPQELCQLPAMVSSNVDQKQNPFHSGFTIIVPQSGGLYNQYTVPPSMLFLDGNNLSGQIPLEIGKLQRLQHLGLANNHFSGHIPVSLSNLKHLEWLDLSKNNLVGEIPASLESLNFLSDLNVSYNDLQGMIPAGGQFATFDESSFEGNPGLCGKPLLHPCYNTARPEAKDQPLKGGSHDMKQSFLDGLFVGFATGFVGILVIVASYAWINICNQKSSSS